MSREDKNIGSIIIFIAIIIAIIVGGYFLINNKNNDNQNENVNNNQKESIKIDDNKAYIYYSNEQVLSDVDDLVYKDININIRTVDAKELQKKLNEQMVEIKKNINYENDKIKDAEMLDYSFVTTNKYLSLTVSNYIYQSDGEIADSALLYYVFDLENGKLLSNKEIMDKEGITDQTLRSKVRNYLNSDENADIDATLNQNYSLSITNEGKVVINILVKSLEQDYYANIEM